MMVHATEACGDKWHNKIDQTINTYLLTKLSPSWESANFAATEEFPSILRSPKIHHRVYKSSPLVRILSQIDPVHTIPSCLSKIHFNIVHPSVYTIGTLLLSLINFIKINLLRFCVEGPSNSV
jgi:hypothetical protein